MSTVEEKIEDEIDMMIIKEYEESIEKDSVESYDHEEVKKILFLM